MQTKESSKVPVSGGAPYNPFGTSNLNEVRKEANWCECWKYLFIIYLCDIPELGDSKPLTECSKPKLLGPCNDIQCVFEKSGFLVDRNTLNKDVYKKHLRKWAEAHDSWTEAVERAIADCVDKELRQYLDYPCRAYDVFTCTGIAMLKKCPQEAWKC
ncbi:hypothetical protein evm_006757 [Chilo suppressalis]|nr:hypothetical protein evm_006757 [Chilo suppressalis]